MKYLKSSKYQITKVFLTTILIFIFSSSYSQQYFNLKQAFKEDIKYLKKTNSFEASDLIIRINYYLDMSIPEIEEQKSKNDSIDILISDIKAHIIPREPITNKEEIEKKITKGILIKGDYSQIVKINIQNSEWTDSKRKTYSYLEFDAVVKDSFNKCILLNGYYKKDYSEMSRHKDQYGQNIAYVMIEYKREMNCKNLNKE